MQLARLVGTRAQNLHLCWKCNEGANDHPLQVLPLIHTGHATRQRLRIRRTAELQGMEGRGLLRVVEGGKRLDRSRRTGQRLLDESSFLEVELLLDALRVPSWDPEGIQ